MEAEIFAPPGAEDIRCSGGRDNDFLEAVDRSTFHVHAQEHGNFAKLAAIAQQGMGLARRFDIAHEKDDARGLQFAQHLAQRRRDRGAIEAHDQQLTDLLAKF